MAWRRKEAEDALKLIPANTDDVDLTLLRVEVLLYSLKESTVIQLKDLLDKAWDRAQADATAKAERVRLQREATARAEAVAAE